MFLVDVSLWQNEFVRYNPLLSGPPEKSQEVQEYKKD